MSEKLSRCRKELAAAIDRAMEDLSMPFLPSRDTSNNQDSDLPIVQLSTPPNVDIFNSKGEVISPTVYCPQPSSTVSSPEKENPLLRSNLFPVTVTSTITCTKREPLMSKENTWLHAPIFMADKQYFISLQDSERWKKGQVSKTDERSMKSETNIISCDVPPENPKVHEDMCAVDESSAVHLGERNTFRKVLEHSPEDEAIIETLLDMEEEYRLNSSTLHQLH